MICQKKKTNELCDGIVEKSVNKLNCILNYNLSLNTKQG